MSFTINYDASNQCLKSHFIGTMNVKQTKEFAGELAKQALDNNCHFLLNDLRDAEINMTTFELYSMPMVFANEGMDRKWKRAILCKHDQLTTLAFYENVAKDKGWNVKIFTDADEALSWLKI